MSKNPTAYLRRESHAAHQAAYKRDAQQQVSAAVLEYCLARGAFAAWQPLRLGALSVRFEIVTLEWNPDAPPRVRYLVLMEKQNVYNKLKTGMRKAVEVDRYQVPNWDYDGVCPLVAREPWEREGSNRQYDYQARWRDQNAQRTVEQIKDDAYELEARERIASGRMRHGIDDWRASA